MQFDPAILQKIIIYALPVLLAITVHEAAHAYAAKKFGDSTAFVLGRMTLNPIKHIDPIGTVLIPMACLLLNTGFLFGYAKPVPVNFGQLNNPKRDMMWVSAAGPGSNLLMALGWAVLFRIGLELGEGFALYEPWMLMSQGGILINVSLMVLNLIPIPPLDGGRIVESLLPRKLAYQYSLLEPYGMWILIALLATNSLGIIMLPVMKFVFNLIYSLIYII